jgi:hypothetical protein
MLQGIQSKSVNGNQQYPGSHDETTIDDQAAAVSSSRLPSLELVMDGERLGQ